MSRKAIIAVPFSFGLLTYLIAESERGTYLHPDSFNQLEEKNVLFAQHPQ